MRPRSRSTPAGEHRAVMLREVLDVLNPRPGQVAVDCTVGWAGHAIELLQRVGAEGFLLGLDLDPANLPRADERLKSVGFPYSVQHQNFAGVAAALQSVGREGADLILADLGFSSMQVDDPTRGFSYRRDGPLDMRLDPSRGRTAAQILATIAEDELARCLRQLADEPHAEQIARAIVRARHDRALETTTQLAHLLLETTGQTDWRLRPKEGVWKLHPAARTFQTLRILVNRELANLEHLLRVAPILLNPGGTVAILSFHSGEDRLVKAAFRDGRHAGAYELTSDDPVRAGERERFDNPRSRSAKLRWARRTGSGER